MAIIQKDLGMLKGELSVFNYTFSKEENKITFTGPDVKIVVTTIEISTHYDRKKEESFSFGSNSRLIIHTDRTASWKF